MNHFGANTWIWVSPLTIDHLRELAPRIAGWEFDGIEMPIEDPDDWDPGEAAEVLQESGLLPLSTCAVLGPGRELTAAPADDIQTGIDYMHQAIDITAALGASRIIGPMYASVGRTWLIEDRKPVLAQLVENLKPLADHAGQQGVTLAVEALNRFETSVMNTVEQVMEVVDRVASPALGVGLDTFHTNIEEKDPIGAIRMAGDRIAHVQASGSDRGAPGNGHIDWAATARALRDVGYDGPVCVESFTSRNATIAVAASIWRDLEPTQDDIARTGLATLQEAFSAATA